MTKALPVVIFLASMLVARASPAPPMPEGPVCCACLPEAKATTGSAKGVELTGALFCAELPDTEAESPFRDSCQARGGGDIECVVPLDVVVGTDAAKGLDHVDCNDVLRAERIACPNGTQAPLLDRRVLGGLGLLLVGLGVATLRRRRA